MSEKLPKIAEDKPVLKELEAGSYFWCACGMSKSQPFCDGSHAGSSISPVEFTLSEKKKAAFCLCKHTKNQPFCDGSHKELPIS